MFLPFGISILLNLEDVEQDELRAIPLPANLIDAHQQRQKEWRLSRAALKRAFVEMGFDVKTENMTASSHQQLRDYPDFQFSISHSQNTALIWLARKSDCRGLGADLENKNRNISSIVQENFIHSRDEMTPGIESWCIKEAAYKSLFAQNQTEIDLKNIYLSKFQFRVDEIGVEGHWLQEERDQTLLTYAWIK